MKKVKGNYLLISIIFITIFVTVAFYVKTYTLDKTSHENITLTNSNENLLTDIDQSDLNKKISNQESFYVYIGRPSCPDCRAFMPKLEDILSNMDKQLLYYNIEVPASKKQAIRDYLKSFGVNSIPSIISFSNGDVTQLYDCQDNTQVENFIKSFKGEI